MALKVLAADGEQIANTDTVVTSALAFKVKAFLPAVDDGTGATVAEGYAVSVEANADGDVELVDVFGRRVATVRRGQSKMLAAVGDVNNGRWLEVALPEILGKASAQPANGAVAASLSANGPAGMTAASSGWMRVQKEDGTEGLVAVWDA